MTQPSDFAPFNLGEVLSNAQNMQIRRLQIQNEQAKLQDARDEKTALASLFGGGGPATPGASPSNSTGSASGGLQRPNQQSIGALMRVNPEMAFQVQKYFDGLDEQSRKLEQGKWTAAGPLLVQMQHLPYAQRQQFMQSAAPMLVANGWKPEEIASFDPTDQNVNSLATAAMTVDQVMGQNKIEWHQIGENGSFATNSYGDPVGNNNPFAPGAQSAPQGATAPGNAPTNNNPGALRVPGSTKFQSFATPEQGIAAQGAQLSRYMQRGVNTIQGIVETYAPRKSRGGDNTDEQVNNYINYVSGKLGIDPHAPLTPAQIPQLGRAMREFETGHRSSGSNPDAIRAKAQAAIQAGADPAKVRERAAALGVTL